MNRASVHWAVLGVVLVGVIFLARATAGDHFFSETVAAWVQAIGSILAIVAGFAAGRDQARSAHAENLALAAQADRNARLAAVSLAAIAQAECSKVLDRLKSEQGLEGSEVQRLKRSVEYQREMVAGFPLASLKDAALMRSFAPFAGALDAVADNLREIADTTMGGRLASTTVVALVAGRLQALCEEGERALEELERLSAPEPR